MPCHMLHYARLWITFRPMSTPHLCPFGGDRSDVLSRRVEDPRCVKRGNHLGYEADHCYIYPAEQALLATIAGIETSGMQIPKDSIFAVLDDHLADPGSTL